MSEAQDRVADQLENNEGIRRLSKMVALKDMEATMAMERQWVDEDSKGASLWGSQRGGEPGNAGDDMGVMAGGNVTINHNYGPSPKSAEEPKPAAKPEAKIDNTPLVPSVPATPPTPAPSIAQTAGTALSLGTALALGGPIGLGLASIPVISSMFQRPSVVVQQPDVKADDWLKDFDLYVGPPKAEDAPEPPLP